MEPVSVAYIGLDHPHRDAYLASLDQLPVRIVCACDADPSIEVDENSALSNVPLYQDPATLFEEESVDVAWISLSNKETPTVVETAVNANVDVFSEKPMARTAAELRPVAEAVRDTSAAVCVAYPNRAHPAAIELRRLARRGLFGDVRSIEARLFATTVADRVDSSLGRHLYDREASRGGILQWLACHWVDLIQWILEEPITRVNARLNRGSDLVDVEDVATLQYELASGAVGTLNSGYLLGRDKETGLAIYGEDGCASTELIRSGSYCDQTTLRYEHVDAAVPGRRRTITYEHDPVPGYLHRVGLAFMQQFLERRVTTGPPPADIDDALSVLSVLDAAYESSETGEWTDVEQME